MNADFSKLGVVVLDTCQDDDTIVTSGILSRRAATTAQSPLVGGFVATTLTGLGVGNVMTCDNVEAARQILADTSVDAIVLHTGDGDEVAVTRALRTAGDNPARYVPVVLVATGADAVRRAYEAGVYDFVAKPIAPAALSRSLSTSLGACLSESA